MAVTKTVVKVLLTLELDALAREVSSADIASSDGGSSDDMPDSKTPSWMVARQPNMHQHFYQHITFHVIYCC